MPCGLRSVQRDSEPRGQKRKKGPDGSLFVLHFGAGNETRTRDPDLGKVVLYQLSYSRNVKQTTVGVKRMLPFTTAVTS